MQKLFVLFLIGFIMFTGTSCGKKADIYRGVQKIWSNKSYAAFTDIIKFDNKWYCVFREGTSHVSGDGVLRVMTSTDTEEWEVDTVLRIPGTDLRDPKFVVGLDGELIIYCGMKETQISNIMWKLASAGAIWTGYIKSDVSSDWLWKMKLNGEELFSLGYNFRRTPTAISTISLYTSNRQSFPNFRLARKDFPCGGCPTESAFLFLDDRSMVTITRRDCENRATMLGIASYPYDSIQWTSLNIVLQSPNMIQVGQDIYVAGRIYNPEDRTALFKLDLGKKQLKELTVLPSGYDTGYPGLYYDDGTLYISYYSEDTHAYRAIYLSRYKIN
ncbi:hypothetical protein [Chitinophaga sp. Ak27]|uniref:hypothetical protein n=1 Tax=Chitinophaga sp. Ak27 TaxID=2726116 RepID=UPI00145C797A|nr:hypothetical protein [Chitinophaga sp. Ak27]NLU94408.1 hypothetical protein [Chitinophaga sp. Ak27]